MRVRFTQELLTKHCPIDDILPKNSLTVDSAHMAILYKKNVLKDTIFNSKGICLGDIQQTGRSTERCSLFKWNYS